MDDGVYGIWSRVISGVTAVPDDPPEQLRVTGPAAVLPSRFDVTGLAVGSVAAYGLAAARLLALRTGGRRPRQVSVDTLAACAAFGAEGLFTPVGWDRAELWDPIAGNYRTADGWIRLHTNYVRHRRAVERVLHAEDRESVAAAAAIWAGEELQEAVIADGGAAAVMHDRDRWRASAAGQAAAAAPPVTSVPLTGTGVDPTWLGVPARAPFDGVRVLDLTRVIAGPDCTKILAGLGADVLRVDPPGFDEVESLLPDVTVGKHTARLDLRAPEGRERFADLVRTADVLVSGYRHGALTGLGYDDEALLALNPALVHASLTAYGDAGPWHGRRGFDSLVQMAAGIAAAGAEWAGKDVPTPLPVQALDHATGHLLAAAVADGLSRRLTEQAGTRIRASLVGAANLLWDLPQPDPVPAPPEREAFGLVDSTTAWGPARRVPLPALIDGVTNRWRVDAGPLGRHEPRWQAGS